MVLKRHDGFPAKRSQNHHNAQRSQNHHNAQRSQNHHNSKRSQNHHNAHRLRCPLSAGRMVSAASIAPLKAAQPQCGHHSATVVQTSISGPSQQQMLFYSSVQCRGGAFTKTAQETKAQLARTGVLPTSTAYRKRARTAEEAVTGKPPTAKSRFTDMQDAKAKEELRKANAAVLSMGANRFALSDDEVEEGSIV